MSQSRAICKECGKIERTTSKLVWHRQIDQGLSSSQKELSVEAPVNCNIGSIKSINMSEKSKRDCEYMTGVIIELKAKRIMAKKQLSVAQTLLRAMVHGSSEQYHKNHNAITKFH